MRTYFSGPCATACLASATTSAAEVVKCLLPRSSLAEARRPFSFGPFSSSPEEKKKESSASRAGGRQQEGGDSTPGTNRGPMSEQDNISSPFPKLPIEMLVPGRTSVTQRVASAPSDVRRPFSQGPANSSSSSSGRVSVTGGMGQHLLHIRGTKEVPSTPAPSHNAAGQGETSHGGSGSIASASPPLGSGGISCQQSGTTVHSSSSNIRGSASSQTQTSSHATHDVVHNAKMSAAAGASAFAGALHRATGHTILPNEDVQSHAEHCVMGYSSAQIYNVVADVEKYHEFLPWCNKSVVLHEDCPAPYTTKKIATLHVGFAFLKEQYTSDVTLVPSSKIVATIKGSSTLLKELTCHWSFRHLDGLANAEDAQLLAHYFSPDRKHHHHSQQHLHKQREPTNLLQRLVSGTRHHSDHHRGESPMPPITNRSFPPAAVVDFRVTFAFRNPLHNSLSSLVMSNVVSVMTGSFESRCQALHGKPTCGRRPLSATEMRLHEWRQQQGGAGAQNVAVGEAPTTAVPVKEKTV